MFRVAVPFVPLTVDQLAGQMLSEHGPIRVAIQASRFGQATSVLLDADGTDDWFYTFIDGTTDCQIQGTWRSSASEILAAAARHVLACNHSTQGAQVCARELLRCLPAEKTDG